MSESGLRVQTYNQDESRHAASCQTDRGLKDSFFIAKES